LPVFLKKKQDSMKNITTENKLISIITTGYFCLSFYVFGCLILENNVNYATWHLIRKEDFGAFHQQLGNLLQPYFFLPMLLHVLFNVPLHFTYLLEHHY